MEIKPFFQNKAFFPFKVKQKVRIVHSLRFPGLFLFLLFFFFLGGLLVLSMPGPIFFDLDALISESIF